MSASHLSKSLPEFQNALDSSSVLGTLLDSVPCGVLIFDVAGELRVASGPLAGMLGIDSDELRAPRAFESFVAKFSPRFAGSEAVAARWRRHFYSAEANWDELELIAPRRVLERFGRPLVNSAGLRVGWLEVYRDITAQRLMENKLFHTERMVALGQLVSSVAHEINNPLTTIYGYAQLLLSRREGSRGALEPQLILQEAERATRIARNLLLFARGAKVERTAVHLNEVIQRTMALRNYELSTAGIQIHLNLAPDLPPVLADVSQLQQVILNLITNAEQALEPSRGLGQIWLRTRRASGGRVALDVADNGTGIAPEILPHIFDPFFTTKPPGVGTGIGLSIVRGIVQEHGGQVSAESQPGQGARFTVEWLIAAPLALELPPSSGRGALALPATVSRPATAAHRQRILVIEDEPTVARLIADVLTDEGYSVETTLDGRQGLALLQRNPYDLLLCDLRMPHLDGRAIYRELLRLASPLSHRVVFVTGDTLLPGLSEFLASTGAPCLAKPFLVDELRHMVRGALAASSESESAEANRGVG